MTQVEIAQLKQRDVITFEGAEDLRYTVTASMSVSKRMKLWALDLRGAGSLNSFLAYEHTKVVAVEMYREVEVPCRAQRHEDGPLVVLHNFANGPAPRAVICGQCDDEITAEVVTAMKLPRRGDTVLIGDSERKIRAFDEDEGTILDGGRSICASKLIPVKERMWRYDPDKESN